MHFESKIEGIVFDQKSKKRRLRNVKVSKRAATKSIMNRKKNTKTRQDFHRERREEQLLRNRKLTENIHDERIITDCCSEKCAHEATKIFKHMGNDFRGVLIDKINEYNGSREISKILKTKNLSRREMMQQSYFAGAWYAVKNILGLMYSYFMEKEDARRVDPGHLLNEGSSGSYFGQQSSTGSPSGGSKSVENGDAVIFATPTEIIINEDKAAEASADKVDQEEKAETGKVLQEKYVVESKIMRYLYSYHWAEFEKLKKVCKEIRFQTTGNQEFLCVIAADHVDEKKFKEKTCDFVSFYQTLYQNMYREELLLKQSAYTSESSSPNDTISEIGKRFSVIVSQSQEGNKCFVYGEKSSVKQAVQFFAKDLAAPKKRCSTNVRIQKPKFPLSLKLSDKLKILVYQGNIVDEDADAIVNPSNTRLKHKGGAALAIVNRGGKSIQDECDNIMNQRRRALQPGDVTFTSNGRLPCKFIIHAVGPRWNGNDRECRKFLHAACMNSLELASKNLATSIAIPAVSSGSFGVPTEICAEELYSAAEDYSRMDTGTLREIRFVNIDLPTVQVFEREMRKRFRGFTKDQKGSELHTSGTQETAANKSKITDVTEHKKSISSDNKKTSRQFQDKGIKPVTSPRGNLNGRNQASEGTLLDITPILIL